jgi:hypothetical protein
MPRAVGGGSLSRGGCRARRTISGEPGASRRRLAIFQANLGHRRRRRGQRAPDGERTVKINALVRRAHERDDGGRDETEKRDADVERTSRGAGTASVA